MYALVVLLALITSACFGLAFVQGRRGWLAGFAVDLRERPELRRLRQSVVFRQDRRRVVRGCGRMDISERTERVQGRPGDVHDRT